MLISRLLVSDCTGVRPDAATAQFRSAGLASHAWLEPELHRAAESLLHSARPRHQGVCVFYASGACLACQGSTGFDPDHQTAAESDQFSGTWPP